jgi:hypothetical protein
MIKALNMKTKFILLLTTYAVLFGSFASAQSASCDTLRNYSPADPLYELSATAPSAGFIWGHNLIDWGGGAELVQTWAEPYNVAGPIQVRRLAFVPWKVKNAGGSVTFRVYSNNGGVPGTVLSSQTVTLASLTENILNEVDFTTPASVNGAFWVGMQLTYSPGDSIALLGTYVPGGGPNSTYVNTPTFGWEPIAEWYAVDNSKARWLMDVLVSNGPDPVLDIEINSTDACLGTNFEVDGSSSTNSDYWEWFLTNDPVTQIIDDATGPLASLTPTATGLHRIYAFAHGSCRTDGGWFNVNVNTAVTATVTPTSATCNQNNGQITISGVSGGFPPPYGYSLDGVTFQSSGTFSNLAPGPYTVYVGSNGAGCIAQYNVTVSAIAPQTVSVSSSATSICAGEPVTLSASGTGSIQWQVAGSTVASGSTYNVTPGVTTTYTAILTDANNCQSTDAVTINVTPLDDATFNYVSSTLCSGGANETPTINATGTFTVNSPNLVFANTSTGEIDMSQTQDGTYTITFTTNGVCPNSSNLLITITSSPEAEFSYAQSSYCKNETNPFPIFGSGASAGTFSADIAGLSISPSTGVINLAASTAGTYNVTNTIAAAGACLADQETVQITIYDAPTATVTGGGSVCGDGSTPIDVTVTLSGAGPWNFTYSDGTSTQNVTNQSASVYVISASNSGTYTVPTVSDQNCTASGSGSALVMFNANPTVSAGGNQTVCEGALVTLTASGAQTYVWTGGVENGVAFTATTTETYEVTGTDGNGCTGTATVTVTVNENPEVTLSAFESLCVDASPLTLSGGSPAGGAYSGTGVTGGIFNPSVGAGTYDITYTYTSSENCTGSATQSILVESCASIEDWAMAANLTIFPNPVSDELTISFFNTSSEQVRVSLLGADGKLIAVSVAKPFTQYTESTDVTSLASGMYMVRFETAMGTEVRKVIVN